MVTNSIRFTPNSEIKEVTDSSMERSDSSGLNKSDADSYQNRELAAAMSVVADQAPNESALPERQIKDGE